MLILSIETSCDDTSIAVVRVKEEKQGPKFFVLANEVSSQIKLHSKFGGVVPDLASREHLKNLPIVFQHALQKSGVSLSDVDILAVTNGPGLIVSLLMGVHFARAIGYSLRKKIVPVHHISGHIYSNWLSNKKIDFPALNLVVSGGHTELILMKDFNKFKIIGSTRDDAAGEAFDKVAKLLGLGYPGGPIISKLAEKGNPESYNLPRPMINSKDFDFSFSGLKTAVLYLSKKDKSILKKGKKQNDFCASFQKAVCDVLIKKTIEAAKKYKVKSVLLSGGVSANQFLRESLKKESKKNKLKFFVPDRIYSTDNAAMIAASAYFNQNKAVSWKKLDAYANLKLR